MRNNRRERRLKWKDYRKFADVPPAVIDGKDTDPNEILQFATFVYEEQVIFISTWEVDDERVLRALSQKYPSKSFRVVDHSLTVFPTPVGDLKIHLKVAAAT